MDAAFELFELFKERYQQALHDSILNANEVLKSQK